MHASLLSITAGDRDRTFVASQNPHGKEPCGLTFFSGPISDPLSYDKGYAYLLNIIVFFRTDFWSFIVFLPYFKSFLHISKCIPEQLFTLAITSSTSVTLYHLRSSTSTESANSSLFT